MKRDDALRLMHMAVKASPLKLGDCSDYIEMINGFWLGMKGDRNRAAIRSKDVIVLANGGSNA